MFKVVIDKAKKLEFEEYADAEKAYLKAIKKYEYAKLLSENNEVLAYKTKDGK